MRALTDSARGLTYLGFKYFIFDILDNQGELVEIREGRFDQIYED